MRSPLMLLRAWSEVDAYPWEHIDRPGDDDQFEWWLAEPPDGRFPMQRKENHASDASGEAARDGQERA